MKHSLFLILLLGLAQSVQAFSYPENVFAFELDPNTVQYFVAPSNNKIRIQRTLEIQNQGFFIDVRVIATINKQNFPYDFTMQVMKSGEIYLRVFGDKVYNFRYPEEQKLLMPNLETPRKSFKTEIGDNISLSYNPKNDTLDTMSLELKFGEKNIQVMFGMRQGVIEITTPSERFTETTLRFFDLIK
ncbi:MAG: hypothetical protein ACRCS8_00505 [Brevinema sp.]